jgi:hypothetical protein
LPTTRTTGEALVDVAPVEADELAHAQAARVRDLEKGAVAETGRGVGQRRGEQAEHVVHRQVRRQRLVLARRLDAGARDRPRSPRRAAGGGRSFTAESLRAAELRLVALSRSTRKATASRSRVVQGRVSISPPARAAIDWASWFRSAA